MKKEFSFENLKAAYSKAIKLGYKIVTCEEYYLNKAEYADSKILVNRIDVDIYFNRIAGLVKIFNELKIKGSFFIRLHAPEYNPFSFESYRIIKSLIDTNHEIGYHSEIVDQSHIWNEPADKCLERDIKVFEAMFNYKVKGIASHGGFTGYNNLDFWKSHKPSDYGMMYEAYDTEPSFNLFSESFYISDSEWTRWKCYDKGILVKNNHKTFQEHLEDNHPLIYLLIHSDTYFKNHFYEY
jgi:hypothetical protein